MIFGNVSIFCNGSSKQTMFITEFNEIWRTTKIWFNMAHNCDYQIERHNLFTNQHDYTAFNELRKNEYMGITKFIKTHLILVHYNQ